MELGFNEDDEMLSVGDEKKRRRRFLLLHY